MPFIALLATAALCLGFALLPCPVQNRRPARRDLGIAAAVLAGVWVWAFLFFGRPGLFVDFGLFRLCALGAAAAWVSACVCGFRLLRALPHPGRRLGAAALLVFTALGFEIFLGNVQYFATHDYVPIQLFDYLESDVERGDNGEVILSGDSAELRFADIDQPLYNLQLEGLTFLYDGEYPDRQDPLFTIQVTAADEANAQGLAGGSWDVAWKSSRSWSRVLDFSGKISWLTLSAAPYDGEYIWHSFHYSLTGIAANAPQPFRFSLLRFAVIALVLLAGWALRPSGSLWNRRYFDAPARFRPCVAGLILAFSLAATLVPFADPINSGVATSYYNVNNWDGVSNVYFTKHINDWQKDASSQLGALAHSLLNGRLDLELDPPEALVAMDNPYDTVARAAQAPDALWDVAYYNGRYYVYFGVVPCLLFQLPFEAVTGTRDLPPCIGMIVMGSQAMVPPHFRRCLSPCLLRCGGMHPAVLSAAAPLGLRVRDPVRGLLCAAGFVAVDGRRQHLRRTPRRPPCPSGAGQSVHGPGGRLPPPDGDLRLPGPAHLLEAVCHRSAAVHPPGGRRVCPLRPARPSGGRRTYVVQPRPVRLSL